MENGLGLVEEIEATIKSAASGSRVLVIRLVVGKGISVSKTGIASYLHDKFPGASIEIREGKQLDAVVVKDIEVE